jgi:large subunit ribosomal protein L29
MDALRAKDAPQLKQDLQMLRELDVNLRFRRAFGQLENTAKPGNNRKNIARVRTVLREKQIQRFLLTDTEVGELLTAGIHLSAGKSGSKAPVRREDLSGNDARSMTLVMRLWAHLRKDPAFFERTQQIPRI